MNSWRLIESPAAPGAWNMAVDAALLESAADSGTCCLRFYRWSEPTVSLGYFQGYADRRIHESSRDCKIVRRSTGGGAIVHDREITYSVIVPVGHPLVAHPPALYQVLHRTLIMALAEWGLAAVVCEDPPHVSAALEPFLCFQRRASGDVLLGNWKIAGSAQRRRRWGILQHGSVLLQRSVAAPELPGLIDVGGREVNADQLAQVWRGKLAEECNICWQNDQLSAAETERAQRIVDETYNEKDWTMRR